MKEKAAEFPLCLCVIHWHKQWTFPSSRDCYTYFRRMKEEEGGALVLIALRGHMRQ